MLFEQDQHRSLIEAIVQRNSIHTEDLVREHTSFNQKFFALWEDGIQTLTESRTLSRACSSLNLRTGIAFCPFWMRRGRC